MSSSRDRLALGPMLSAVLAVLAVLATAGCGSHPDPNLALGPDPLVGRNEAGDVVIRFSGAPAGSRFRVYQGTAPDRIERTEALGELGPEQTLVLADVPIRPRPYFELENVASGERRVVAERRLPLEGSHNFRDLGGYASVDGRRVRWGVLYRSDHLGNLTNADVDYVRDLGIRLVCDFRGPSERAQKPDRLPSNPAPEVELLSIAEDSFDPAELQRKILSGELGERDTAELLIEGNKKFVTEYRDRYAKLFARLQEPGSTPTLVHCSAGKDRAGLASALILRVLGVPDETVYQDFLRTNTFSAEHIESTLELIRLASLFRTDPEDVRPLLSVRREYLQAAFDTIDAEYGSFDDYVRGQLGLDDDAREALQDRLLE